MNASNPAALRAVANSAGPRRAAAATTSGETAA